MKRLALVLLLSAICVLATSACAQQFDVAVGVSALKSAPASDALFDPDHSPQSVGGGAFPVISGDFLFRHQVGVGGEVFWRATRNLYQAFGAQQEFRPVFYDFNAVWAPKLGKQAAAQLEGGIGAESARFYTPFVTCNFVSCTNFVSSNHFMAHLGGGLKIYIWRNVFLRPEAHYYFIHDNSEFSGNNATRFGASIGYTWRSEY